MTHVYLNENVIKDALKSRCITAREAEELNRTLERCKYINRRKKEERLAS